MGAGMVRPVAAERTPAVSMWAMIPPSPAPDDETLKDLWHGCDGLERISLGGPAFDRLTFKINVREVYDRHKRAGYVRYFGRYMLTAMEYAEIVSAEDFEPFEKKQLKASGNWFRVGDAMLFRQVGPWKYDEYSDEYYPLQGPLVRTNVSYFA